LADKFAQFDREQREREAEAKRQAEQAKRQAEQEKRQAEQAEESKNKRIKMETEAAGNQALVVFGVFFIFLLIITYSGIDLFNLMDSWDKGEDIEPDEIGPLTLLVQNCICSCWVIFLPLVLLGASESDEEYYDNRVAYDADRAQEKKVIADTNRAQEKVKQQFGIKTISIDGEEDTVWNHEIDDENLREHLLTAEDFWIVHLRLERVEFVQWTADYLEYHCDGEMVNEVEPLDREEAIQTLRVQYLNTMVNRKE